MPENKSTHSEHSDHPAHAAHPAQKTSSSATTYTLITEPDQGLTAIYNLISSAKKSIDMTMYELTDITVTSSLAKAAAAGVTVRVILDQNDEKIANTPAYNHLAENKVGVHWANPAFAVITNNAADVAAIETTFDADFKNASITPPTGDNLVWSPTNSRSALTALINGATKSLLISQEEFDDTGMETALEAALKRGVTVTLVQENQDAQYSTVLTALKKAAAKIAVYTSVDIKSYYIHAKTVLADYGTAHARLFLGSENFSADSLDKNRELGIIFSDAACMEGVNAAIMKDFKGGAAF